MTLVMTPIVLFGAKAANGQTAVQSIPNTLEIRDLACATTTSCVAVGLHELPNNGGGEGAVVPITDGEAGTAQIVPGISDLFGVGCYTSSNCLAVGGAPSGPLSLVVPITNGTPGAPISTSAQLNDVACPTSTTCYAVGSGVLPITNGSIGTVQAVTPPSCGGGCTVESWTLNSIVCPTASTCIAGGAVVGQILGSNRSPITKWLLPTGPPAPPRLCRTTNMVEAPVPHRTPAYSERRLERRTLIVQIGADGTVLGSNPLPNGVGTSEIACPTTANCLAGGSATINGSNEGTIETLAGGTPGTPAVVADTSSLGALVCPTTDSCLAAGFQSVGTSFEGAILALRPPTTTMELPANGATLNGSQYLDSVASARSGWSTSAMSSPAAHSVIMSLPRASPPSTAGWRSGTRLRFPMGPSCFRAWPPTTRVSSAMSAPLSITVDNAQTTSVLIPAQGATLSGSTYLDASATNATSVEFLLFGGNGYWGDVVGTATPTYYGWLYHWDATTVPNRPTYCSPGRPEPGGVPSHWREHLGQQLGGISPKCRMVAPLPELG